MRPLAGKGITDDPVFICYIEDAARVDRFIAGALGCSTDKIKAWRAPSFDESRLRQRLFRFSPTIGDLIQAIHANSVVSSRPLEAVAKVGRMLRIGVAPGINDQGFSAASNLHIQHVVVSMPPVAQRAAVEDQEALPLERGLAFAPAASLNVIAGVWKTDVPLCWRHTLSARGSCIKEVGACEQRGSQLQQVRVISGVAVRESWNPAVRAMAVHSEFARAFQPLVIIPGKAESKAPDVHTGAQIRPQHHHVVVR